MPGINVDWEIQNLNAEIRDIKKALDKKCLTLYGNGQEGMTSKIHYLEFKLDEIKKWKEGWDMVTNYEDYKSMKHKLDWVVSRIYLTGAVLAILLVILKIIPVSDITKLF